MTAWRDLRKKIKQVKESQEMAQEDAMKVKKRRRITGRHNARIIRGLNKVYSSSLIGYSQHAAAGVIRPPRAYNWKSLPEIM